MREERASEFEDRLLEILHSEEHRETDWSKINTAQRSLELEFLKGKRVRGAEKIYRLDSSHLPSMWWNVMKNTDLRS